MRRITVILTHYNRAWQLQQTLYSIYNTKHVNFNVIVIDDASDSEPYIDNFQNISILKISKEQKQSKGWVMPLPAMNMAIEKSLDSDIIILQNAECRHYGDILIHAEENLTDDNYLSYACFSLSSISTYDVNLEDKIETIISNNNICATDSEHDSWYNHPVYRGTGYDFCSAITIKNIIKLNGYDERYATGFCYGDDDFIMRIKRLGLFVDIPTNPIVLHQWHGNSMGIRDESLIIKNRELYISIANNETGFKAKHLYTNEF